MQPPSRHAGPSGPSQLSRQALKSALRKMVSEFQRDNLDTWAAALTYYSVLSLFPGLLVLVAILGLLDDSITQSLLDNVAPITPAAARDILTSALHNIQQGSGKAGVAAVLGLLIAVWSASGYVSGFMQASNVIYDVPEGRPLWKTTLIRLAVTAATGVLMIASILIVVLSGRLAEQVGKALGIASATVGVWNVVKWPVLVVLVSLMFAILYWACPNAQQGGIRWVSPGGFLAVILWVLVSSGFAFYASHFGSYDKTYGTLGGVVVFLTWLWLTNLAILIGAELDAELERQRAIAAGMPPRQEPYMRMRDDSHIDADAVDSQNALGKERVSDDKRPPVKHHDETSDPRLPKLVSLAVLAASVSRLFRRKR